MDYFRRKEQGKEVNKEEGKKKNLWKYGNMIIKSNL